MATGPPAQLPARMRGVPTSRLARRFWMAMYTRKCTRIPAAPTWLFYCDRVVLMWLARDSKT